MTEPPAVPKWLVRHQRLAERDHAIRCALWLVGSVREIDTMMRIEAVRARRVASDDGAVALLRIALRLNNGRPIRYRQLCYIAHETRGYHP